MGINVGGHVGAQWTWRSFATAELVADMTLLAEGLSDAERGAYWRRLERSLPLLAGARGGLLYADAFPGGETWCGLCSRQTPRALLILSIREQTRAVACLRCVHMLETAGIRTGRAVSLSLTEEAWTTLSARYPGAHAYPDAPGPGQAPLTEAILEAAGECNDRVNSRVPGTDDQVGPRGLRRG